MAGLTKQVSGLEFSFRAVHDLDLPDIGADAYIVELNSRRDGQLLQLKLPTDLVERAVLSVAQPFLTMSPDGWMSIQYVSVVDEPPILERVAIDAIIEEAIAPPMLEDEPAIYQMLEELRGRLQRAITIVDATIARL